MWRWKKRLRPNEAILRHVRRAALQGTQASQEPSSRIDTAQSQQNLELDQHSQEPEIGADEHNQEVLLNEGADGDDNLDPNSAHFDGPVAAIAYEDANIRLIVRKADFKKQRNHILTDHLYTLIIQRKNGSSEWPLATSILHGVYTALGKMLEELKDHYGKKLKQSLNRYVYCTFNASGLVSGVNTGVHMLSDNTDDIVNEFRANVDNCMTSYKSMRLDSTFSVQIKVIGPDHMEKKKMKNGAWDDGIPKLHTNNTFFLPVPKGFLNNPNAFQDRCLPLALILSLYELHHRIGKEPKSFSRDYLVMRHICNQKGDVQLHNRACTTLRNVFEKLAQEHPEIDHQDQETNAICKVFSEKFNVNVVVHTNGTRDQILYKYPETYNESLPRIDVHGVENKVKNTIHYAAIKALLSYKNCRNFGLICVLCSALICNHDNTHTCNNSPR